jgi:thiol-disulfide isomerase/thioredoxin
MLKYFLSIFGAILFIYQGYSQKKNIGVYFFMLEDCVICQSYTPLINELHQTYGETYEFVGIFPNFRSKKSTIEKFAEKYDIKFDLRTDYFQTKMDDYQVEITPEVVVVDQNTDNILYQGRIDDEFIEIGRRKTVVSHHDLKNALKEIKDGIPVTTPRTEAVGCIIQKNKLKN